MSLIHNNESADPSEECVVCFKNKQIKIRIPEEVSPTSSPPNPERFEKWILCEICSRWYHLYCANLEDYEESLIQEFHCVDCLPQAGSSIMRSQILKHRYAYDAIDEVGQPVQVGTSEWIKNFKANRQPLIPEAPNSILKTLNDGHELMLEFDFKNEWTTPFKILNKVGLGLSMPDYDFQVEDVLRLVGADMLVDTIDVYEQKTYTMSLGHFYALWSKEPRERLYNILSLEFTNTPLNDLVKSPDLVRQLSWVCKIWPPGVNYLLKTSYDETCGLPDDLYTTSMDCEDFFIQHKTSKPSVENFCLIGMKDSYTDFHIDFGGSSVWYHVFKGQKVFYVAAPTQQNLDLFDKYQKSANRSEKFFGDELPPGELFKVVVDEGQTLFIPSGWIHSVWTPVDSLVFGGNFLHSLNIATQLKVYEMENDPMIDERFKFPYFQLTHWLAVQNILKDFIKEKNDDNCIIEEHMMVGFDLLILKLHEWFSADNENPERKAICKVNKRILKDFKNVFRKQLQMFPGNFHFSSPLLLKNSTAAVVGAMADPLKIKLIRKSTDETKYGEGDSSSFVIASANTPTTSSDLKMDNSNELSVPPLLPDDEHINIQSVLSGESKRGRRIKPSMRFSELITDEGGFVDIPKDVIKSKNFMDQFSAEDKKIIAKSDKMGDDEEKSTKCLIEFQQKKAKSLLIKSNNKEAINNKIGCSITEVGGAQKSKKRKLTPKDRLAKILKIKY